MCCIHRLSSQPLADIAFSCYKIKYNKNMKILLNYLFAIVTIFTSTFCFSQSELKNSESISYVTSWTGPDEGAWIQLFDKKHKQINPHEISISFTLISPPQVVTSVLLLGSGNTVVAYTEITRRYKPIASYLQFFDSSGVKYGDRININTGCVTWNPKLTQTTKNHFIVSWLCSNSNSGTFTLLSSVFDLAGQQILHKPITLITEKQKLNLFKISSFRNGNILVTWREIDWNDKTGPTVIKAQTFDREYKPISKKISVAKYKKRAKHESLTISDPSNATLIDNNFVVVWREGDKDSVFNENIYARIFNVYGESFTPKFRVNKNLNGLHIKPEVTELKNTGFVITWLGNRRVLTSVFDYSGKAISENFVVNDKKLTANYAQPVGLGDGTFSVPWYGCEYDGVGCDYFTRLFDSNGKALGKSERIYYGAPKHPTASSNILWFNQN